MKKSNIISFISVVVVIVATLFIVLSCEKVKNLAKFDISYTLPDVRVTIDSVGYLPKTEYLVFQQSMSLNVDSIINKYNIDGIGNVRFEYIRLEIETPDWVTFSWLNSARATVSAQGINEIQVGTITNTSPDARMLEMQLSDADISSVISAGTFVVRLYGDASPPFPSAHIVILMKSKLKMTVQPI